MAAFPAAKLGALVLKQVSKPIAQACKNYAKSSPFFRKYICMPPAQCKLEHKQNQTNQFATIIVYINLIKTDYYMFIYHLNKNQGVI